MCSATEESVSGAPHLNGREPLGTTVATALTPAAAAALAVPRYAALPPPPGPPVAKQPGYTQTSPPMI
jgi:hypothetical protein